MTKTQKIVYYVLLVLVSGLFIFSGVPKLITQQMAIQSFAIAGLPVWLMYFVGAGEILGAIGLWTKRFFRYAGEGLYIVLIGATYVSAAYVNIPTAIFPVVTGIALGIVIWLDEKRYNKAD